MKVVSYDDKDVIVAIYFLQPFHCVGCQGYVVSKGYGKQSVVFVPPTRLLQLLEGVARAERSRRLWAHWIWRDLLGHRQMRRGTHETRIVTNIAAQQYERVWTNSSSGYAAQMANGMTGRVQKVEGAISEEVKCREMSNVKAIWSVKVNLSKVSTSVAA